jgi:hypothetical protein
MKIIKNRLGNACFLACLESFLYDNKIEFTQEKMIEEYGPQKQNLCSADGVIWDAETLCDKLGISFNKIAYHFPIDKSHEDGSLLIFLEGSQRHVIRFYTSIGDDKLGVMDPNFHKDDNREEFAYWDENMLITNKSQFVQIKLK